MTAETREWKTLRASERDTYPVKILESEITRIGFLDKSYNGIPQRGRKQIVYRLIECMDTGFWNPALISSNVKKKSACSLSIRWLLVYQQPSQPAQKGNQDPQALGTFRGRFHRLQSVKFSPTHTTLAQPCHNIGRQTGLTEGRKPNNTKCRSVKT